MIQRRNTSLGNGERIKRQRPAWKKATILGTWNIKTLRNKEEEIVEEMKMGPERIVRRCTEAREWEKRGRGRPRVTWLDNIKEYGQRRGKTMMEMEKMTKDRKVWREFSEATRR